MNKIYKVGLIILAILTLATVNLWVYIKSPQISSGGFGLISPSFIFKNNGLIYNLPKSFPEPLVTGDRNEGSISFSRVFENTRYTSFFVIAWSNNKIDWKLLLPKPRVIPGGKKEDYLFENIKEKGITILGHPARLVAMDLFIIRTCSAQNKNNFFLSEFRGPDNKYFCAVSFNEKNTEGEFRRILESLKVE